MPNQRKKDKKVQVTKPDNLEQINLNAAGLDIGAAEIWGCVPADRDEEPVRCFDTFTVDLHAHGLEWKFCRHFNRGAFSP